MLSKLSYGLQKNVWRGKHTLMLFEHGLQPQLPALAKLCDLLPKLPVWLGFPTCIMGNERQPEPTMGNVKALWLTKDNVCVSGKVRDSRPPKVRGARRCILMKPCLGALVLSPKFSGHWYSVVLEITWKSCKTDFLIQM